MGERFQKSISFKRQTSAGSSPKLQVKSQNPWARAPAFGRCLSLQESESEPRDLKVIVDGTVFSLHSSLMNKASPAFHVMAAKSATVTAAGPVHIDEITASGFDEIVNWIYHERVQIKPGYLQEIYQAARKLEIEDVQKICDEHIKTTTQSDSLAEVLQTCIALKLEDQLNHVLHNRPEIVLNQLTLADLDINQVTQIFASDHLNVKDERYVLHAAKRWMSEKVCSEEDVLKILKVIRLGLLSKDDLRMVVEDITEWPACQEMVEEVIAYLNEDITRPLKSGSFCQPRGSSKCLLFGGLVQCDPDPETNVPFKFRKSSLAFDLDPHKSHVNDLAGMPHKVVDPVTLSKNNFVFAVGGYVGLRMSNSDGKLQPVPGNLCLRYEARINRWEEMAPMSYSRWCHGAAWCDDYILVIGGVTKGCLTYGIGTVELYDIASNTWSLRSPFPYGIRNLAACDSGGKVYISGGRVEFHGSFPPVDNIYFYDVKDDVWNLAGKMTKVREYHSMVGKGSDIFIVGGSSDVTAEIFDTTTHQSTSIEGVPGHLIHSRLYTTRDIGETDEEEEEEEEEKEETDAAQNADAKNDSKIPELVRCSIAVRGEKLVMAGGIQQRNVIIYNTSTKQWTAREVPFTARRYSSSFALIHTPSGGKLIHNRRRRSSCSVA